MQLAAYFYLFAISLHLCQTKPCSDAILIVVPAQNSGGVKTAGGIPRESPRVEVWGPADLTTWAADVWVQR